MNRRLLANGQIFQVSDQDYSPPRAGRSTCIHSKSLHDQPHSKSCTGATTGHRRLVPVERIPCTPDTSDTQYTPSGRDIPSSRPRFCTPRRRPALLSKTWSCGAQVNTKGLARGGAKLGRDSSKQSTFPPQTHSSIEIGPVFDWSWRSQSVIVGW